MAIELQDAISDYEAEAKPQIYAQPDPEKAVRAALDDLGYPGHNYVSRETYVAVFKKLIEKFQERARNEAPATGEVRN